MLPAWLIPQVFPNHSCLTINQVMLMAIGCSVHLFNRLKKGERFFGCVPREVGDIVYCDTSNPSKEPEENYVRT